jgi:hypothetical protein
MSEWRYSTGVLYFSIYSHHQGYPLGHNTEKENEKNSEKNNKKNLRKFKINTFIYDETKSLSEGLLARYKMFLEVFREIDGGGISIRERAKLEVVLFIYLF